MKGNLPVLKKLDNKKEKMPPALGAKMDLQTCVLLMYRKRCCIFISLWMMSVLLFNAIVLLIKIGLHHLFLYLSQTQLCMSFFALTANGIFPFSLPLFKAQVGHRPYPMKSRTLSLSTGKYCCTHYWTTIPSFCSTCWFKKHMLTTIVLILRQYFLSMLMPKMEFTVNFFTNCKHSSWNSSSLHWIFLSQIVRFRTMECLCIFLLSV